MRFMHNNEHSTSFNPVDFVSAVSEHFQDRNCDPCVQSDAMEFLELLFRHIQGEVAVEHSESGSDLSSAELGFFDAFQGDKWESNESFQQLLVPIHNSNEGLSERLTAHFFDGPELGGPGRPCDCKGEIWRETRLAKLPATLRVVLQRTLDGKGKTSQHVQFPANLKLGGEICDEAIGEGEYDLFGVVVHAGKVAVGGHYTCYVKQDNYWFHLDDGESRLVAIEEVLAAEATALFYHQHLIEQPPGSIPISGLPSISEPATATEPSTTSESSAQFGPRSDNESSMNPERFAISEPSTIPGQATISEYTAVSASSTLSESVTTSELFPQPDV
jgi:hypothetical protein